MKSNQTDQADPTWPNGAGSRGTVPPGFTLIEMMFAVLILGILLGLLIGSVRFVTGMSKATVDRAAVHAVHMGADQFKTDFGFQVPLVRDQDPTPPMPGGVIELVPGATPARNRVSVHKPADANYLSYMRATGVAVSATNPLLDNRYSEYSIAIYLVGQLNYPVDPSQPGVPIDGIASAGFCKPLTDGSFAIPADILHPGTGVSATKRTGFTFEPFVALKSSGPKLIPDANDAKVFAVADRNGIPIRYYRWEQGPPPATQGNPIPLNVPLMVGRGVNDIPGFPVPDDRDISKNANIRGATFAIVAAGPDGVFGDEANVEDICSKLGVGYDPNPANQLKIRMMAEKDNIVEVGR